MKDTTPASFPPRINPGWRIAIIASTFHGEQVEALAQGAQETLLAAGIFKNNILTYSVPGSFEIPLLGAALAEAKAADALLGFGIIVQGETHHAELLAASVAHGMMDVQTKYRIPFAFEVLHVSALEQAIERTKGADNKGAEAARAALWALAELEKIHHM